MNNEELRVGNILVENLRVEAADALKTASKHRVVIQYDVVFLILDRLANAIERTLKTMSQANHEAEGSGVSK